MSMLAEPRRKQKLSVDPRGSAWSKDDSKFGQKMLEKFGWSKGKGLGAKEDGHVDHVKVSLKNDSLGLGCSASYADTWIAHQDDFNALLSNLNQSNPSEEKEKQDKVISLESKSKTSRSRVHYQKFTQGKDLSLKSAKDLDCIFGRRSTKDDSPEEASSGEESSDETQSNAKQTGFITVKSEQSIQDYFAKKMAGLKNSPRKSSSEPELHSILKEHNKENSFIQESDFDNSKKRVSFHIGQSDDSEGEDSSSNKVEENDEYENKKNKKAKKKKNKKRKHEQEQEEDGEISSQNNGLSTADERKEDDESVPSKKKKKSKSDKYNDENVSVTNSVEDGDNDEEKKKRSKNEETSGQISAENSNEKCDKKKKKKKSKEELEQLCKNSDPVGEGQSGENSKSAESKKKTWRKPETEEQLENKANLMEGLKELGMKCVDLQNGKRDKKAKKHKIESEKIQGKSVKSENIDNVTKMKNDKKIKKPKVLQDIEGAFKGSSISDVPGYATHIGYSVDVTKKLKRKEKRMAESEKQRQAKIKNNKSLNKWKTGKKGCDNSKSKSRRKV